MYIEIYKKTDNNILILIGYLIYCILIIISYHQKSNFYNYAGGTILFALIIMLVVFNRNMFKINDISIYPLLLLLYTIFNYILIWSNDMIIYEYLIKYLYLNILAILLPNIKRKLLYDYEKRYIYICAIIFVLMYTFLLERGQDYRIAGIFKNPNNLSLFAFSLLLFINEEKDKIIIIIMTYLFVLFTIICSGTSGATLAFVAGIIWKYKSNYKELLIFLLLLMLTTTMINIINIESIGPSKVKNQFSLLLDIIKYKNDIYSSTPLAIQKYYGSESYSLIWRINHWNNIVNDFLKSDIINIIFGYGLGSSKKIYNILPHNEYIRYLFELGIIGLFINIIMYIKLYKTAAPFKRYMVLIVYIFSISENIIDNILFMSLFYIFIFNNQSKNVEIKKANEYINGK